VRFQKLGRVAPRELRAVIARSACDEAIQAAAAEGFWIASLALAMTAMGGMRAAVARPMSGGDAALQAGSSEIKLKHG